MNVRFVVPIVGLLAGSVCAEEVLHAYDASGLEFHATDTVKKITASGTNVQFHVTTDGIFATALVYRDTRNAYPLLDEVSDLFLQRVYSGKKYEIISERDVSTEISNAVVDGREYLVQQEDDACALILASSAGDRTYVFMNVTELRKDAICETSGAKLRAAAEEISASIVVRQP